MLASPAKPLAVELPFQYDMSLPSNWKPKERLLTPIILLRFTVTCICGKYTTEPVVNMVVLEDVEEKLTDTVETIKTMNKKVTDTVFLDSLRFKVRHFFHTRGFR